MPLQVCVIAELQWIAMKIQFKFDTTKEKRGKDSFLSKSIQTTQKGDLGKNWSCGHFSLTQCSFGGQWVPDSVYLSSSSG